MRKTYSDVLSVWGETASFCCTADPMFTEARVRRSLLLVTMRACHKNVPEGERENVRGHT